MLGVALGVCILIVVISVMNGFEKEVKKRLLAFSPHVTVQYAPTLGAQPIMDWEVHKEKLEQYSEISSVKGTIDDNAIIEYGETQMPITYRGIDTSDKEQVAELEELVIKDYNPAATADMGLEPKGLLLESRATQLGIQAGDVIQLYSTRNFDEVLDAYKRTDRPPAAEEFKEQLQSIVKSLKEKKVSGKPAETFRFSDLETAFNELITILDSGIRNGEKETINEALDVLNSGKKTGGEGEYRELKRGSIEHVENLLLVHLGQVDNTSDDNEELKKLKGIVLPKEIKVVGIYRLSQQVVAPDIFLPLPIAQELSGLEGGVHALSVRLKDADKADAMSLRLDEELDAGWYASSWMTRYKSFFELVQMEKSMMGLVLSLVSVGAAFLIMVVMFLTALQKRKEIGVMLAVGARPSQVCGIFLIQGIIIGILGVLLGVALAVLIIHFRGEIQLFLLNRQIDIFPAGFQGMSKIPARMTPSLILKVSGMGLLLCSIAPLFPALYAAFRDPAKSLRDV